MEGDNNFETPCTCVFIDTYNIGRIVMGQLLCEVRGELNTRPTTSSNPSRWKSFENSPSKVFSVLPSSAKDTQHTSPHSSTKRLSQPFSPFYELSNFSTDKPVKDLSNISSRTEINSSKILQTSDIFHFTDFVTTGVYHNFSTYSSHGFTLDGEYWKSVQHYFQAQKYSSVKWIMTEIRVAATSKRANEIAKDRINIKVGFNPNNSTT